MTVAKTRPVIVFLSTDSVARVACVTLAKIDSVKKVSSPPVKKLYLIHFKKCPFELIEIQFVTDFTSE